MLDELIKGIALKEELSTDDWRHYSTVLLSLDKNQTRTVIKALSAHTGIHYHVLEILFQQLNQAPPYANTDSILNDLITKQKVTSLRIEQFKQHPYLMTIDPEPLQLTRAHWIAIIKEFEFQKKKHVTASFFCHAVSIVQRKSEHLVVAALSKTQPARRSKKRLPMEMEAASNKRYHRDYANDKGLNPFILKVDEKHPHLGFEAEIEATGARTAPLTEATPEKGCPTARTPNNTKVRSVAVIKGHHFFKQFTPQKEQPAPPTKAYTKQDIHQVLPKLVNEQAKPVKYVATLAALNERAGLIRSRTQKSLMGASAREVFNAHGITIAPEQSRLCHWSHLIAHFLGDPQHLITDDDDPIVNLVPSTAAANYNTLEEIELHIRDHLIAKKTHQMEITVTPVYENDSLIPETLYYSTRWIEEGKECSEFFYIKPKSEFRYTKGMHDAIKIARQYAGEKSSDTPPDAEEERDLGVSPK